MFRKKAGRIRGVAGSLEGVVVGVNDAAIGAGPGIVRVAAAAGARVFAADGDGAALDVQLAKVDHSPVPVTAVAALTPELVENQQISGLVVNPTGNDHDSARGSIELARQSAHRLRDAGRTGSIIAVTVVKRTGTEAARAAWIETSMQTLAAEFAPNGIRINTVAVGPVGSSRRDNPVAAAETPLGHVRVHPVEVGKAVWFLLNEDLSAAVTGSTMCVDRGVSLLRPEW